MSPFFTSQQVVEWSLAIPVGLISLGISSELRVRVSRSLCFHLNMPDIPPVQWFFPVIITQTWLYVTDYYWLHLSFSGYQYKNTESFCVDSIPMPWVGTAFVLLNETCWLLIIWDHKICWWRLLKMSSALLPGTSTQKTLFLSQPQQKHQSSHFWSEVVQGDPHRWW